MVTKISTNPYKGTRDFFPEEMRLRQEVFQRLSHTVELSGYDPYDGPMLESFDLYAAKTGDEIVNEQLYSFEDRGGRKVAIRPEMTPTLARMVAQRSRELAKPIRWYSIPNLWRYENPQKGRLREHWQLNVDIFGIQSVDAEIEIMTLAIDLMLNFGADSSMFRLYFNHRQLMNRLLGTELELAGEKMHKTAKLIDKMKKISPESFSQTAHEIGLTDGQINKLKDFFQTDFADLPTKFPHLQSEWETLNHIQTTMQEIGYGEFIEFSPQIMRGFDYYTGTVFEIYDLNPENRRSLYGGGRYDNLLGLFGAESMSGIGFGLGDVTLFDFLNTHGLMPQAKVLDTVMLGFFPDTQKTDIWRIAEQLKRKQIRVEIPWDIAKLGKQFQNAEKKGIFDILLIEADYQSKQSLVWKELDHSSQREINLETFMILFKDKHGRRGVEK